VPKPFRWAKMACFHFSSSILILLGHIPSTSGVPLSSYPIFNHKVSFVAHRRKEAF
jgi:hypothetical protein